MSAVLSVTPGLIAELANGHSHLSCVPLELIIIGSFLHLGTPDFPSGGRNPPLHSHGMGPPGGPMGSGGHMPRPYPPSDDIDPQATRSLFVGNIPKNISVFQLRDIFQRYGDVLVSCVWTLCSLGYELIQRCPQEL